MSYHIFVSPLLEEFVNVYIKKYFKIQKIFVI